MYEGYLPTFEYVAFVKVKFSEVFSMAATKGKTVMLNAIISSFLRRRAFPEV